MNNKLNQRQLIYEAAAELFFKKGYHATSMRELARAVKLDESTLYHYYPSKQSLLYEILTQGNQDLTASIDSRLKAVETTKQKIRVFLAVLVNYVLTHQEEAGLIAEMRNLNPKQRSELKRINMAYIAKFQRLLEKGIKENVIRPCENVKFRAILVLRNATDLPLWYHRNGLLTVDEVAEIYVDQTFQGLLVE